MGESVLHSEVGLISKHIFRDVAIKTVPVRKNGSHPLIYAFLLLRR